MPQTCGCQAPPLTPDPQMLLAQLRFPGLATLVAEPTLTEPWTWNLGDIEQTVYAIEFRRAVSV